jgi:hypothetical protein
VLRRPAVVRAEPARAELVRVREAPPGFAREDAEAGFARDVGAPLVFAREEDDFERDDEPADLARVERDDEADDFFG